MSNPALADQQERAAAIATGRSFVVQAPAGSGKTELLIQRYLSLLATVDEPEAVLAITFTVKAAGEMRARVLEALNADEQPEAEHKRKTWLLAEAVRRQDRQRGWHLLSNAGRLQIQTIDSFNAHLVRRMPWLSRHGGELAVSPRPDSLYRAAAQSVLKEVGGSDPELSDLLGQYLLHLDNDFNRAEAHLAAMLQCREQWLGFLHVEGELTDEILAAFRGGMEAALANIVERKLAELATCFPADEVSELLALARFARDNQGPESELKVLAEAEALTASLPVWLAVRKLLCASTGGWRRSVDARSGFPKEYQAQKQRMLDLLGRLQANGALLRGLQSLDKLPPEQIDDNQWALTAALIRILPFAASRLEQVFVQQGTCDFSAVAIAARQALRDQDEPSDLAFSLGCRLRHVLIDEFQDTSVSQLELLQALLRTWDTGETPVPTLFIVGDPMQSIYRFRQAEVGVFLDTRRHGIEPVALEPLQLRVNFRSTGGVVKWVNHTFAQLFAEREEASVGAVQFAESVACQPVDGSQAVTLHPFFGRTLAQEADEVVRLVQQAQGSTAILVRARTHLLHITAKLREHGIRYRATEIDPLHERPAVLDLLALTRALLHLADRVAWLAILRAPWCGLSLHDLEAIAGRSRSATLWELLPSLEGVSADGRARLARVLPVLTRALDRRGRLPLPRWIEATWVSLGGPAAARSPEDLADAARFFDLLAECDREGVADTADLEARTSELFAEPDPEAPETLQVMTIHKAKGLEWDNVIVPGLGKKPRQDDRPLLVWHVHRLEAGPQLLLAPLAATGAGTDPCYQYVCQVNAEKSAHETVRLLYVAATRARRALHLLGTVTIPREGKELAPAKGSFLDLLWRCEEVRGQYLQLFAQLGPAAEAGDEVVQGFPIRRLRADWRTPQPAAPLTWTAARPVRSRDEEDDADADNPVARAIGTVVHALLESIGRDGLGAWPVERVEQYGERIAILLAQCGVAGLDGEAAVPQVIAAVAQTLRDERGRWILSAHEAAAVEWELAGTVDGVPRHFKVDRTFVADGVRWIIDYKTSQPALEQGLGIFLDGQEDRYQPQLEQYRTLLRHLEPGVPVRAALYFPLLGAWREVDATREAAHGS